MSCTKKKYLNQASAEAQLEKIRDDARARGRKRGKKRGHWRGPSKQGKLRCEKRAYKCSDPECGYWHLTSKG